MRYEAPVADRVRAGIQPVEQPSSQVTSDSAFGEAEPVQLLARNHTELLLGQDGQRPSWSQSPFTSNTR